MKNNYSRNFTNKILMKTRDRQHVSKCNQQPEQPKRTVTGACGNLCIMHYVCMAGKDGGSREKDGAR